MSTCTLEKNAGMHHPLQNIETKDTKWNYPFRVRDSKLLIDCMNLPLKSKEKVQMSGGLFK